MTTGGSAPGLCSGLSSRDIGRPTTAAWGGGRPPRCRRRPDVVPAAVAAAQILPQSLIFCCDNRLLRATGSVKLPVG